MLGFIFPEICLICAEHTEYLCRECLKSLSKPQLRCFKCGRKNPFGIYCLSCKKKYLPDKVIARFVYHGKIKDIIHQYKYEDASVLSGDLAKGLTQLIVTIRNYKRYSLTFVPLSNERLRFRGYNQSELLATRVAETLNLEVANILERKGQIETQVISRTKKARRVNIKGVFTVKKGAWVPEEVILIDDVVTTGATIEEATKVLKKSGAKKVIVATLAMSG